MALPHRDKFRRFRCWLWHGAKNDKGYGVCRHDGRLRKAHHVIWEAVNGRALDKDMELDHTCSNRRCVNPEHLEEVTHAENMRRMWEKRRMEKAA